MEEATVFGSMQQKDFLLDAARWCTILAENARNVAITGINYWSIMSLMLTLKLGTTKSCASDMIRALEIQQNSSVEQKCKSSYGFDFQQ